VREFEDGGGQALAGATVYGPARAGSDADHARLVRTNLRGTVFGARVAIGNIALHAAITTAPPPDLVTDWRGDRVYATRAGTQLGSKATLPAMR
jgi:hypothetical protein